MDTVAFNSSRTDRLTWIDVLKGIGIFYVTFGHLYPALSIEKHIYSFHMFLFFFLSGFVYKRPLSSLSFIKKKAISLLLPFIFWDALATIIDIVISHDFTGAIQRMLTIDGELCWDRPIWFLLVLFFVEIIYMYLDKLPNWYRYLAIPVAVIIGYFTQNTSVFLKLTLIPISFAFYSLGCVAKASSIETLFKRAHPAILMSISLIINIFVGVLLNNRISVIAAYYGNYILCLIAGLSGIVFYVLLSQAITIKPFVNVLEYIGKHSKTIMCAQYFCFSIYSFVAQKFFNISDLWHFRSTVKALILSCITIALICLFSDFINKLKCKPLSKMIGT